jgi:hypothetical protein
VKLPAVAENDLCPLSPEEGCVHDTAPNTQCRMPSCPYGAEMRARLIGRLRHHVNAERRRSAR